jgi:hypothetical protein
MTTMTRRQIYDLIWSKPMRDAAAEIGLSDVGLKKVCIRHRVPVPPQGYWNKVHAGQKPSKAIFRDVNDARLNRVEIAGSRYNPPPEMKKALIEAKSRESAPDRKIEVPPIAPPALPAAVRLAAALKKSKHDDRGLVYAIDPKLFPVRVAAANVDRAVSIVEALLVAAADRSFGATTGAKHLTMVVDGESIVLGLKETTKRTPHVLTQEEIDRQARRDHAQRTNNWELSSRLYQRLPDWDYHATGQLFLEIEDKQHLNVRARWSDTATRRLETMLNDVLAGLVAYAAGLKQRREEQARWHREWELKQQREVEARARAELEKARVEFLERRLTAFEEMSRLDRFLSRLSSSTHWHEPPPRFQEFVQWAERRVQQLKRQCSAEALLEALTDSSLFGPNPKSPSAYPYYDART